MKKKRALAASRIPDDYSIEPQGSILTIHDPSRQPNSIIFNAGGDGMNEMIRISPEGFWVRGERVPQDDKEALIVYNAFKEFLTWNALTRRY